MPRTVAVLRERISAVLNHDWFVGCCLAAAAVVRLLWIFSVNAPQVSDYSWYYQRGIAIAQGQGYSVNGIPTLYWPVGYPGFLGLLFRIFGLSVLAAKLANVVLYVAALLLIYRIGKQVFNSEPAARIAVCLLAFSPNQIAYSSVLSTEILFVFLLLLGATLFLQAHGRTGWMLLAGASWGLAALTKPQALAVPLVFAVVFFNGFKVFCKTSIALYAMVVLVLAPWIARNYQLVRRPLLSANGGIVLMIGNNPYATGAQIWDERVISLLGPLGADEAHLFDGREAPREAAAASVALRYMIHNPVQTLSRWPLKLKALYGSDMEGIYYSLGMLNGLTGKGQRIVWAVRILAECYYVAVLGLFLISIPSVWRSRRQWRIGWYVIAWFTLVYLLTFGNPRYHFALMPWFAMYAGLAVWAIVSGGSPNASFEMKAAPELLPSILRRAAHRS